MQALGWTPVVIDVDDAAWALAREGVVLEHVAFLDAGGRLCVDEWAGLDPRVREAYAEAGLLRGARDRALMVEAVVSALVGGASGAVTSADEMRRAVAEAAASAPE